MAYALLFYSGCLKQNIYIAAQSRIWSIWRSSWRKNGTVVLVQRRLFLQHRIRSGGEAAWANTHSPQKCAGSSSVFHMHFITSFWQVALGTEATTMSVTESQKGWGWWSKGVEVEGPPKTIWPSPLLSLDPVAQDHVQMAECLQRGRLHNLPGQLFLQL